MPKLSERNKHLYNIIMKELHHEKKSQKKLGINKLEINFLFSFVLYEYKS